MEEAGIQSAPSRFYTSPQQQPRESSKILFVILGVIVIALLIFGATRFFGSSPKEKEAVVTPTPTEEPIPTDTPTPEASPTPQPTNTPTPKPTANPLDKATGLDRSKLSVSVLNGSGVVGAASKLAEFLRSLGYKVASVGNADNYNYVDTSIDVRSQSSSFLPLLRKDLQTSYTIGSTSAALSATGSADAVVIVGK